MSNTQRALVVAGAVAAMLTAADLSAAQQAVAPSFTVRPVLVKSAGGAFLHYQLDRQAVRAHVTIAGRNASIRHDGAAKDAVYDAFVKDASLRSGKVYAVSVSVDSSSGGRATRSEKLFLHRTFPSG
jgi:hypothetical protein